MFNHVVYSLHTVLSHVHCEFNKSSICVESSLELQQPIAPKYSNKLLKDSREITNWFYHLKNLLLFEIFIKCYEEQMYYCHSLVVNLGKCIMNYTVGNILLSENERFYLVKLYSMIYISICFRKLSNCLIIYLI